MMDKTIEKLVNDLMQIDIDASYAYEKAIDAIEEQDIRQHLEKFKSDHLRHIENLSTLLRELGGTPIKRETDLKGKIIEGMTWLQGIMGTKGALNAMVTNEKITNKKYDEASKYTGGDLPEKIREQINHNYNDEKRHLEYVQKKLTELKEKG